MTNQDEELTKRCLCGTMIHFSRSLSRKCQGCGKDNKFPIDILLNKARQQGIDNTIIECEKKKELWIDRERKSVYEQGKKDGIEAERKRIIEMIEENFGFPPTSTKPKEICISESEWKQLKNSEANGNDKPRR